MKNRIRMSLAKKKLAEANYLKRWEAIQDFRKKHVISHAVDEALKGHPEKRPPQALRRGRARRACLHRAFYRMEEFEKIRKAKPDQPRGAARAEANRNAMARYARSLVD
jgi:hypothetical protein